MGLPATRNTSYLAGSLPTFKALDLNALQDLWVLATTGTSSLFATPLSVKQWIVDAAGNVATTLAAGITAAVTGGSLQLEGASGDTNAAGQSTTVPTARKLWWQWKMATGEYARLYYTTSGLEITVNAVWGGATWTQDSGADASHRVTIGLGAFEIDSQTSGHAAWADGAWNVQAAINILTGKATITGDVSTGNHYLSAGSAPSATSTAGACTVATGSTDAGGQITFPSGAGFAPGDPVATVTYASAYPNHAFPVISPVSASAPTLVISAISGSQFTVTTETAIGAGVNTVFAYNVSGS